MRLIDAGPLIDECEELLSIEWNQKVSPASWAVAEEEFLQRLLDAHTVDAVPVVRCKDCLWYENLPLICHLHSQFYDGGRYWDMFRPDDFCSDGERKEGDG